MDEVVFEDRPRPAVSSLGMGTVAALGVVLALAALSAPMSWVVAGLVLASAVALVVLTRAFATRFVVRGHVLELVGRAHVTRLDLSAVVLVRAGWILNSGTELSLVGADGTELRFPVDRSTRALRRHVGRVLLELPHLPRFESETARMALLS